MDITYLASTLYSTIGKLTRRQISGPIYVTRGGEQVAVIIRSQAYAPKLDQFRIIPGDDAVYLTCKEPIGPQCECFAMHDEGTDLGTMLDTANQHWADNHREPK